MKNRAFTLIELMIVIAIIAIIAAIAIPSLVSALSTADEGNATGSLSAVRSAQGMYRARFRTYGDLTELGAAGFLTDPELVAGAKSNYTFVCTDTATTWRCVATPVDATAGQPTLTMTEAGVLYNSLVNPEP